jgi:phthiocerol/phenolphthiocerol synthesis type-I polyketide synthase A
LLPVCGEPVREPLRCRPDAAYLVTGGMGALGLLIAGWLADRGARRLILAGRTPLPPRRDWDSDITDADTRHKIAAIRALELRGVSVDAVALDVGSPEAVQALLAKRDADGAPPIRGVVHAAGITDAQLLTEVTESRLRHTMSPKIAGAQALHEVFSPGSLDFLFMTAAAGAVFGVPGQGAYAAANSYLDGLARARHRQGCHTVSLDWVVWRGLGFASDAQIALQELERLGSRAVTPQEAFTAWEYLERYDVAQAVMAPLPSSDVPMESDAQQISPAWSEMSAEDVLRELQAGLRGILASELQMPEAEFDLDRPFAEFGLNSVMAMTVRRDTEQFVGIELSATMLFNYPTVVALAEHLAKKLLPQTESDSDVDPLGDSDSSVLDDLFDSVESAPAGSERGI